MEDKARELITILASFNGYDIGATLQHGVHDEVGFNFMGDVKKAIIHVGTGLVTVSEPVTGKYVCFPLKGIKEIQPESCENQVIALTVTYQNDYSVNLLIY